MNAIERQLAAILVADVAGYTRLTENNEMATHVRLMDLRHSVMEPGVGTHSGRIVKTTGDGFLATFASIMNASLCAVALQSAALSSEAQYPLDERLLFRIGLHVGDVIVEDNDIFGEGVNIAARLQQSAEPGGIVISAVAHEQLGGAVPAPAVPIGAISMKNISRPVRALRLLTDASAAPASLVGSIDQASVAVLPFANVGSDARNAYFGDGIVEDIIANLANFGELTVISRSSTLAYSGIHVDARTVGRQLGVRYVLNGRVSRDAHRLRVTAELSDAESSMVVWTGRYDAAETDLFDIQDQLAAQIVHVIAPQVHARELRRIRLKRPEGMDAYDLVLQALNLHNLLDRRAFSKAGQLLRRAIKAGTRLCDALCLAGGVVRLAFRPTGVGEPRQGRCARGDPTGCCGTRTRPAKCPRPRALRPSSVVPVP